MGRIQHYEDNDSDGSAAPSAKRKRRRKNSPSEESSSSRTKRRNRRKAEAGTKKKKKKESRSEASASPPKKRHFDKETAEPQSGATQQGAGTGQPQSGFTATASIPGMSAVGGMPGMTGLPGMPGMPNMTGMQGMPGVSPMAGIPGMANMQNVAAMSAAVGADLNAVKSFSGNMHAGANAPTEAPPPRMEFSKPKKDTIDIAVQIQKSLVSTLMTPDHRTVLFEESGAAIEWDPTNARVLLSGSQEQLQRAQRLLTRVRNQCCWGQSIDKVRRLLRPREVKTVRIRLSPVDSLPACQKTLSAQHPLINMGKGPENHLVLPNPYRCVSRQHCIVEFDEKRGGVYVHDCSTNGTFLNGIRLPSQQGGKVLVSHGDELSFKDPAEGGGGGGFGYIVNLEEIVVKAEAKLEAPKRLLTSDELNFQGPGSW